MARLTQICITDPLAFSSWRPMFRSVSFEIQNPQSREKKWNYDSKQMAEMQKKLDELGK